MELEGYQKLSSILEQLGFEQQLIPAAVQEEGTEQYTFSSTQVVELARNSPDFLAGLAMPDVFKYMLPAMYHAAWEWMVENIKAGRTFPQLALGLPRGFAKTTLIKLFILYCILYTDRKYILIVNNIVKLAINTLKDICSMLSEPNIVGTYGNWQLGIVTDQQDFKVFSFRGRTIILHAIGAEGSVRGTNADNSRPDLMVFDDIQSRECADSEIQSQSLEQWLYGTAMKAKSPSGCMYLFLANMYPTVHSILRKLKNNPTWVKFIVGGILSDGTSLWEELQPISQLYQEFQNDLSSGHPEIFYSEVLNDENASMNRMIDTNKIPEYPYEDSEIATGGFIIIDPSNDKHNSDLVAVGACLILAGYPVLVEVLEERLSPGDTIRKALQMASKYGISAIFVESNAYQYSMLYWFKFICTQLGIQGVNIYDIYSGGKSKTSRILEMFKQLIAAEVFLHPRTKTQVLYQISQWNYLRNDNVDNILDLLTYIPKVISNYPIEVQLGVDIVMYESQQALITDYDIAEF